MMVLGNLIIYVFGVAGLMILVPMSLANALAAGVLPVPDLSTRSRSSRPPACCPATWKLVNSRREP